ncbi:hypothetical protein M408DRAFT_329205 [Serendipita vermifera MAFF 305830]|uniref:PNPLA domain-containing protein n=1 Tax=Serendipita vermifera MAFF 305830 TaxID=933852 RepID=A0A0C3AW39_SERVB|nr:hypothetical protein M408DRAFT_329205 [Serendipita vermifera MAFF 305830]
MTSRNGLLLLSLDGGGARSFSQLVIMKELMTRLKVQKYPNNPEKIMLPCEEFDMIGGSDTGGLLAIMFTRLKMSVDEAMDEFAVIVNEVYKRQFPEPSKRSMALRACLERMLKSRGLYLDSKLEDSQQGDRCVGFSLVLSSIELRHKVCLRSYRSRRGSPFNITVIDAMLATCASSPAFAPLTCIVGPEEHTYVGAGLGANNPSSELISEAHALYGGESKVACLLSLGAGHPGVISMNDRARANTIHHDILSDGEMLAQELQIRMKDAGVYFRLSVGQGLRKNESTEVDDVNWITTQAEGYLKDHETDTTISSCAGILSDRHGWIVLDKLSYTGAPKPVYKAAPLRAQHYVRRKGPWKNLDTMIQRGAGQKVIIMAGMTGCGKTQLVTEVLHEYNPEHNNRFSHTFFVDGSSESSIKSDLISYVQLITGKDGSRINFEDTMNFFQNPINKRWLIVYDNVDDLGIDLRPLLPLCEHGVIIVTTRNQLLRKLASENCYLGLDVMLEEEAVELILKCAEKHNPSKEEQHEASLIAEKLGYLPIALTQAGCFISNEACSCSQYLNLLSDHLTKLMEEPSGDRQNRSAYAAFDLTYRRLPHTIQDFLHLLSFFHFANFPVASISIAVSQSFATNPFLFEDHGASYELAIQLLQHIFHSEEEWSDLSSMEIVRVLRKHSLASITSTPLTQLVRIHPLMREWAFDRIPSHQRAIFQEAACRVFISCIDAKHLYQYLPQHIQAIMSRLSTESVHDNNLTAFGKILRIAEQLRMAQDIWRPIVRRLQDRHSPNHLYVATAKLELAATYDDSQLIQMEELEREVIRVRIALLGPTHLETLRALYEVSGTLSRQERYKEAQGVCEEILRQLHLQVPPSHPFVIEVRGLLASLYGSDDQLSRAEEIQRQILDEQISRLGRGHLDTLEAMRSLAATYHELGRHTEALKLQLEAFEGRKRQLGENNPDTLAVMEWLALTYHELGSHKEAERLRIKILAERKAQLGMWHSDTFAAMDWLALTYQAQSRWSDAQRLRLQQLEGRRAQLGEDHPDTLLAMSNLAVVYSFHARHNDALPLQRDVLTKRIKLEGENSVEVATCMHNLAWTYYDLGLYTDSKQLAMKAERICRVHLGTKDPGYKRTVELITKIDACLQGPIAHRTHRFRERLRRILRIR